MNATAHLTPTSPTQDHSYRALLPTEPTFSNTQQASPHQQLRTLLELSFLYYEPSTHKRFISLSISVSEYNLSDWIKRLPVNFFS